MVKNYFKRSALCARETKNVSINMRCLKMSQTVSEHQSLKFENLLNEFILSSSSSSSPNSILNLSSISLWSWNSSPSSWKAVSYSGRLKRSDVSVMEQIWNEQFRCGRVFCQCWPWKDMLPWRVLPSETQNLEPPDSAPGSWRKNM